jgi:hypothetical protein
MDSLPSPWPNQIAIFRSNVEFNHEITVWLKTFVSRIRDVLQGRLFLQAPKLGIAGVSRCRHDCAPLRDVRLLDWLQNLVANVTASVADPALKWENERRPGERKSLPFDRLGYIFRVH